MFSKLQKEIQSGRTPDLIRVFEDIDTLKKTGDIVPFAPSEKLINDLETMPPFIREALKKYLVTEDGLFWGCVEGGLHLSTMLFYVPGAWADSPFRDRTPPTSYEEFLDFAEVYLDTPHEGFCLLYNWSNEKLGVQGDHPREQEEQGDEKAGGGVEAWQLRLICISRTGSTPNRARS